MSYKSQPTWAYCVLSLLFFVALCTVFIGCSPRNRSGGSVDTPFYEGTLLRRNKAEKIETESVSFDFEQSGSKFRKLKVNDSNSGQLVLKLDFATLSPQSLELTISSDLAPALVLSRSNIDPCFSGHSQESDVTYCETDESVSLEVLGQDQRGLLTLTAVRSQMPQREVFAREQLRSYPYLLEEPQSFTLFQAIKVALSHNFNSRMEFERVMQAKDNAKASALNLLPHLSLSTGLALHSGGPLNLLGVLSSIGDLAPFLLPTRWFQAKSSRIGADAESDAQTIMQADLASQVESLTYALNADQQAYSTYVTLITRTRSARDAVQALETAHKMPAGSTDTVETILDSMMLDQAALKSLIETDKEALAQSLGFMSPDAVIDVSIGTEIYSIERASLLSNAAEFGRTAIGRSFELRQMDKLIEMAKVQNQGIPFSWLDPACSPGSELGFGLGATMAIGRSQVRTLLLQKDQLEATILVKVRSAVESYNAAIESYSLAQGTLTLQEKRVTRVVAQIVPDLGLSTMDVEAMLQDYLAAAARVHGVVLQFRIARANLDRLLLQGYFHTLQPFSRRNEGYPMG